MVTFSKKKRKTGKFPIKKEERAGLNWFFDTMERQKRKQNRRVETIQEIQLEGKKA